MQTKKERGKKQLTIRGISVISNAELIFMSILAFGGRAQPTKFNGIT